MGQPQVMICLFIPCYILSSDALLLSFSFWFRFLLGLFCIMIKSCLLLTQLLLCVYFYFVPSSSLLLVLLDVRWPRRVKKLNKKNLSGNTNTKAATQVTHFKSMKFNLHCHEVASHKHVKSFCSTLFDTVFL